MFTRRHALASLGSMALLGACKSRGAIRVGSKNFSESVLLGEIVAQRLTRAGLTVDHRANLGGTFVCHEAMKSGDLDVYVEYTGTALVAILKQPPISDGPAVRRAVDAGYTKLGMTWLPALGFDDGFAILVRRAQAKSLGLAKVSDLAAHTELRPGFGYEFVQRADGYTAFAKAYGLAFAKEPTTMELGLTYRALSESKVDVIAGNATSGVIDKLDLVQLDDDRRFFPPYEAAPIVRNEIAQRTPKLVEALSSLAGKLTTTAMRTMNYAVDADGKAPKDVARAFLDSLG